MVQLKSLFVGNIFLLFNLLLYCEASRLSGTSIMNGSPVEIDEAMNFPYIAILQYKGKHNCGVVIIHANVVLTSAHCVKGFEPSDLNIKAGTYNLRDIMSSKIQIRNVRQYFIHEDYYKNVPRENDIAIIILETNFVLTNYVNWIPIATERERDGSYGKEVIALGWGQTEISEFSKKLLKAKMELITLNRCGFISRPQDLHQSMVCAISKTKDTSICIGDSGGPLIRIINGGKKHILLGIASFAYPLNENTRLCDTELPSVFADVVSLTPWISRKCGIPKKKNRLVSLFTGKKKA